MSIWDDHKILSKVEAALNTKGRPYMTSYQLAIKLERANPGLAESLGKPLGGAGVGSPNSLAEYLAGQLVTRIKHTSIPVEGAFLSNDEVRDIRFAHPDGGEIVSSLTGTGLPVSIFRWNPPADADV